MRKNILLPLMALLAGGVGFYFNLIFRWSVMAEYHRCTADNPYPMLMAVLAGVVALVLLLLVQGGDAVEDFSALCYTPSALVTAMRFSAGFLLLCGSGLSAIQLMRQMDEQSPEARMTLLVMLVGVGCSFSGGIGLLGLGKHLHHGTAPSHLPTLTVFPVLAVLPPLLSAYKDNSTEPIVALYANMVFAYACILLGVYFVAEGAFETMRPKCIAFFSLMGVYFGMSALEPGMPLYQIVTLSAFILMSLANASSVLGTTHAPHHRRPAPTPADDQPETL